MIHRPYHKDRAAYFCIIMLSILCSRMNVMAECLYSVLHSRGASLNNEGLSSAAFTRQFSPRERNVHGKQFSQ